MDGAVKPKTAQRYTVSLRKVKPFLAGLPLVKIDRKKIAEIASRPGVSNATRRRDLTAVSAVLRSAVAWGWIDSNPAREWDRSVIRERRDPITPPDPGDLAYFLSECPEEFRRLIAFLAETGCRQEEAAGLEWRQIDKPRGTVTLTKTKTGRPRTISLATLGGDARGTIRGTKQRVGCPYVFWHGEGERFKNVASNFAQIMRRVVRQAEKAERPFRRFRCHDLRHYFAIRWLTADRREVYALKEHLGHSSVKTTEIYLGYVAGGQSGGHLNAVSEGKKGRPKRRKPR